MYAYRLPSPFPNLFILFEIDMLRYQNIAHKSSYDPFNGITAWRLWLDGEAWKNMAEGKEGPPLRGMQYGKCATYSNTMHHTMTVHLLTHLQHEMIFPRQSLCHQ
jgi:hypothetical protein